MVRAGHVSNMFNRDSYYNTLFLLLLTLLQNNTRVYFFSKKNKGHIATDQSMKHIHTQSLRQDTRLLCVLVRELDSDKEQQYRDAWIYGE